MTLTEAQRLAFLKGREKRMANLEKKKLEAAEQEMFASEAKSEPVPDMVETPPVPKPKVKRTKTIKPKVEVKVKVEPDPDPVPEPETAAAPVDEEIPKEPKVSDVVPPTFDEDAFADKIVSMLMSKGINGNQQAPAPPAVKPKKERKAKAKPLGTSAPPPPVSTFSWL
jgi:hypothetical protein